MAKKKAKAKKGKKPRHGGAKRVSAKKLRAAAAKRRAKTAPKKAKKAIKKVPAKKEAILSPRAQKKFDEQS
ncbi:MAG: histone, partial [Patescibacteria group bacterium]